MKLISYCSGFILLTLIAFPLTAEAFGRRPSHSEVAQSRGIPGPLTTEIQNDPNGRPPQSVPEPSSLWLVGIGLGLIVLLSRKNWLRGQVRSQDGRTHEW
jgi:hypothetical protein